MIAKLDQVKAALVAAKARGVKLGGPELPLAQLNSELDLDELAQKFPAATVEKVGRSLAGAFQGGAYQSKPKGTRPIFRCP